MKILIVHAHPEPKSFNGAMTRTARETLESSGHDVRVSDLYAMGFDPVSDRRNFTTVHDADYYKQQPEERHAGAHGGFVPELQAEQEKLTWCDALILQFPLWWFGVPAILKGWVDRVFAVELAYGGDKWYDQGVFRGKRAMLSLTTGGPPPIYTADGISGDLNMTLFPINYGILRFTGFDVLPPFVAWGPASADEATRKGFLASYAERLREFWDLEPIKYPSLDEYDPETFLRKK